MPKQPLVSIIIPTYNRAHLIGETLDSVLAQTYTNWECLVVDDGSTDATEVLVQTYIQKDTRFQYHKRPETHLPGGNGARNYGFELSKGTFINWFDSDDMMMPEKLELQLNSLEQYPNAPYCICQTKWIDKKTNEFLGLRAKRISSEKRLEDYILYQIFWSVLAPVWRRDFIIKNKLSFDETLQQSQEYDFHIKALAINSNYIIVDKALAIMYRHDDNLSNSIYSSSLKLQSNISVKTKIVNDHLNTLTANGKLKFLEIVTLFYKDVLSHKKLSLAFSMIPLLYKILKSVDLPFAKKTVFCLQLVLAYGSYCITGRGYGIVRPIEK